MRRLLFRSLCAAFASPFFLLSPSMLFPSKHATSLSLSPPSLNLLSTPPCSPAGSALGSRPSRASARPTPSASRWSPLCAAFAPSCGRTKWRPPRTRSGRKRQTRLCTWRSRPFAASLGTSGATSAKSKLAEGGRGSGEKEGELAGRHVLFLPAWRISHLHLTSSFFVSGAKRKAAVETAAQPGPRRRKRRQSPRVASDGRA